ncbi:MAG: glycosyltransferase, partial [Cryomorphaceae bacterium]
MEQPLISVVSPVYRAEGVIPALVSKIQASLESITKDYEIILVNDSSPDDSWGEILKEAQKDDRIKGIDLSRNFGQHQAILCGLENAKGQWAAVIDCDLQEDPASIA